MWLTKKLKPYKKESDWQALLAILIFLIIVIVTPSVKVFFILAFTLLSFLVLIYSFPKAFLYASLPLSYVSMAQTHTILVVPAKAIISNQYWEGRHLIYSFSPFLFISLIAILMILFWQIKLKKYKLKNYHLAALALILSGFLSVFYASLIPSLSFINVLSQFCSLTITWYLGFVLINSDNKERQKILLTLFLITSSLIFYESLFVFKQTLSQSPIGLAIEATQFAPVFGLGSDESGSFRPFGLQAHPNGLANQQLIWLSTVLLIYTFLRKKTSKIPVQKILLIVSMIALASIILSLSRAAFVAVFAILFMMWIRHRSIMIKANQEFQKKLHQVPIGYKLFTIFILGFLFLRLSNRLLYSIYSFSEFGGISTRTIQYGEAIEVFKKSPIFGIGDRMFIPTSYQLFPKGVMTYFPEEVHSGLLLLFIERGLLGGTTYLVFLFLLIKKIRSAKLQSSTKSVLYSGLLAGFIMMIFHPEKNFFSIFTLFAMSLLENKYDYKFTS